jgi:hypothetical protein
VFFPAFSMSLRDHLEFAGKQAPLRSRMYLEIDALEGRFCYMPRSSSFAVSGFALKRSEERDLQLRVSYLNCIRRTCSRSRGRGYDPNVPANR